MVYYRLPTGDLERGCRGAGVATEISHQGIATVGAVGDNWSRYGHIYKVETGISHLCGRYKGDRPPGTSQR